jgi:hypothetical protein
MIDLDDSDFKMATITSAPGHQCRIRARQIRPRNDREGELRPIADCLRRCAGLQKMAKPAPEYS